MNLEELAHLSQFLPFELQRIRSLDPCELATVRFRTLDNPAGVNAPMDVGVIGIMIGSERGHLLMYCPQDRMISPVEVSQILYADIALDLTEYHTRRA